MRINAGKIANQHKIEEKIHKPITKQLRPCQCLLRRGYQNHDNWNNQIVQATLHSYSNLSPYQMTLSSTCSAFNFSSTSNRELKTTMSSSLFVVVFIFFVQLDESMKIFFVQHTQQWIFILFKQTNTIINDDHFSLLKKSCEWCRVLLFSWTRRRAL